VSRDEWTPVVSVNPSEKPSFGAGGARVVSISLVTATGGNRSVIQGGEPVIFRVAVEALEVIDSVIIGFHFKDRLGQVLFGENTCLQTEGHPVSLSARDTAIAEFRFDMPNLRTGSYALDVAVADGTQYHHVQHQWFFDVMVIDVQTDRTVFGLLHPHGVKVTVTRRTEAEASVGSQPLPSNPSRL
jgi:lipopolysaccharide transport system ATP-binding protein